jgi:hypothetical protein
MGEWLKLLRRIREVPGKISAWRPVILTEVYRGFPQYVQANVGIVR